MASRGFNWHCIVTFTLLTCVTHIKTWDVDDFEIFDLVEEIQDNFYTRLNVTEDVDAVGIRKAFRKLSLVLHPDKNAAADAEVQFRQLVAMYDVLKEPKKREKYNAVLKNGLPNWKSAVYYYRHVRKIGLVEMFVILFIVISIGQYVVGWAAYVEKRYNLEEQYKVKLKKSQKKSKMKAEINLDEEIHEFRPSLYKTLPFQIVWLVWTCTINIPSMIGKIKQFFEERRARLEFEENERKLQLEIDESPKEEIVTVKKRKPQFVLQERDYYEKNPSDNETEEKKPPVKETPPITGGLWTDDDLLELIRLIKKYPQGTASRWERIAEAMRRSVAEVTFMAAKMKDNCYRVPEPEEESKPVEVKRQKTKKQEEKSEIDVTVWSQDEQKALENALTKFPKGVVGDRWEKIANCVPNKNKDQCIQRYKYLVELVKKEKQK